MAANSSARLDPDSMNWATLEAARHSLGHTQQTFADLLGVALSTYKGWGQRGKIPRYIANSVKLISAR